MRKLYSEAVWPDSYQVTTLYQDLHVRSKRLSYALRTRKTIKLNQEQQRAPGICSMHCAHVLKLKFIQSFSNAGILEHLVSFYPLSFNHGCLMQRGTVQVPDR